MTIWLSRFLKFASDDVPHEQMLHTYLSQSKPRHSPDNTERLAGRPSESGIWRVILPRSSHGALLYRGAKNHLDTITTIALMLILSVYKEKLYRIRGNHLNVLLLPRDPGIESTIVLMQPGKQPLSSPEPSDIKPLSSVDLLWRRRKIMETLRTHFCST